MLVTFEAQPGVGKLALMAQVEQQLRDRGISCTSIWESTSTRWGRGLDPVFWPQNPEPEAPAEVVIRALETILDMYSRDEHDVQPAMGSSDVVLKDRHTDTVFYTLAPALGRLKAFSQERAMVSLELLMSELLYKPDLTIYVEQSLLTRVELVEARRRALCIEPDHVTAPMVEIFDAYERVAQRLIDDEPRRFLRVDNDDLPLAELASPITDAICARLAASTNQTDQ